MRIGLLMIGDEILDGRILDTNSQFLERSLAQRGLEVSYVLQCRDGEKNLAWALESMDAAVDLVLASGGLGPTEDDRTREIVAAFVGKPLVYDEEAWAEIQARFRKTGREAPEANRRQALLPEGGGKLDNPVGTAPGFWVESPRGTRFVFMPGVPSELKRMFQEEVLPRMLPKEGAFVTETLCFGGVSESELGGLIADELKEGGDVRVGSYAQYGMIRIVLTSKGRTEEEARAKLRETAARIQEAGARWYLGRGDRSLQEFVVEACEGKGITLAVAESCTGGKVAAKLVDVPGASSVFLEGQVTYANAAKIDRLGVPPEIIEEHGAVSEECARAMVEGLARTSGARLCASVTGIAGPSGGSVEKPVGLVFIGCGLDGRVEVFRKTYGARGRAVVREWAANDCLLAMLRMLGQKRP
ncbi:MAG TPA: competence/damage-inducible protein A [Planctomycetes bacterium]|nr:competence/damage-inducible protein A [Planctomycetota bacterium]